MIPKEIIKEVKIVLSGDAVMADQAREVVSLKFFKRIGGVLGLKPNLAITFTPWL
tara:strand:+ start:381 stop:545 length:165 start_codon:yes stop_codon:yes gene_type:complete